MVDLLFQSSLSIIDRSHFVPPYLFPKTFNHYTTFKNYFFKEVYSGLLNVTQLSSLNSVLTMPFHKYFPLNKHIIE